MKKVILFGASGGIGTQLSSIMRNYDVVLVNRDLIDFTENSSVNKIKKLLDDIQPDIIINCSGVFGYNKIDFDEIFSVNLRSNWNIIDYYVNNQPHKKVKFLFLGSSCYNSPRKNYMLYASTKSALYNLYQSASEVFEDTKFILGLITPEKTYTKMISDFSEEKDCLNAGYVAEKILSFMETLEKSSHIKIK